MPRKPKAVAQAPAGQAKANGETVSGYFRKVFAENPGLLDSRSNDELLQRWLKDHPGETEVPTNVKVGLQNVKSVLRSKGRRKKGRKQQLAGQEGHGLVAQPKRTGPKPSRLEQLEERIDDTLMFARGLDDEGLKDVISHLRRARNEVVWKMGQ
jgi:hypothetical protein